MSRVKRTWKEEEKPVKVGFLSRPRERTVPNLQCPVCGRQIQARPDQAGVHFVCLCGVSLQVIVTLRLEELEDEEVKGD